MNLRMTVIAKDRATEACWARELEAACLRLDGFSISAETEPGKLGQLVFIDAGMREIDDAIDSVDRKGRAIFLIVRESDPLPSAILAGAADDVLVYPFRGLEVQSKIRHFQQILMWDEVSRLNASFSEVIQELHEDLKLAERLQKSRLPIRFPEIKGMRIASRYAAGMRSGGDHFDLAESKDGAMLSMVLSDSSSYGLSSAVLGALMRVANRLSSEQARSSLETVQRIREEIQATLKEKDRLSLFYGVLSKKDFRLRYLNLGSSCVFYAPPGKGYEALPTQAGPITLGLAGITARESELVLEPGSRLALLSDGFVEALAGLGSVREVLNHLREREPADTLNELVFKMKAAFGEEDEMPPQDCTGVVFEVDQRLIRLAG